MKNFQDFAQYLSEWGRSERTISAYISDLTHFARWFEQTNGDEMTPETITPIDIREYKSYLLAVERSAPATINRRLAALRAYADWARNTGQIETSPVLIKGVKEQQTAPKWLDRREQNALIREGERMILAARTEPGKRLAIRDRSIVVFLINTGLRIAELCALDLADIEIRDRSGQVRVRKGKGEKARTVPLNSQAREAMKGWLEFRENGGSYVFTGKQGGALQERAIQRRISSLGSRVKLTITPHTLRHTFAKNLVNAGISLEKVAALLGHSNLSTTQIYITPGMDDLEKAVGLLD